MKRNVHHKLTLLVLCLVTFASCKDQMVEKQEDNALQLDEVYRPLLHHFGSTGCTGCGTFGAPLLHTIADDMGDSVVPLITHFKYDDPFITESSMAIEKAMLSKWYSPQVWLNSDDITFDIIGLGLDNAIVETKKRLRKLQDMEAKAYVGMQYEFNSNQRFDVNIEVKNAAANQATYYVEVYTMEDGPTASQAGADPYVATHYRVNRGGHYGGMGKEIELASGASFSDFIEVIPCWGCGDSQDLYFYIIVWQKNEQGAYTYVNGRVVR